MKYCFTCGTYMPVAHNCIGKGLRTYIAGPMEGLKNYNHRAFKDSAKFLEGKGDIAVCPAIIDQVIWGFDGTKNHCEIRGMTRKAILSIDFTIIPTCNKIYMLKGWEFSGGATAELAYAMTLGLVVEFEEGAKQTTWKEDAEKAKEELAEIRKEHEYTKIDCIPKGKD